ncbi:MAG: hypothetical protein FWG21_05400, partial [Oscillospiraceae bacterium]|nr:hypothetical protein [Oscillospiraceae bacterium]
MVIVLLCVVFLFGCTGNNPTADMNQLDGSCATELSYTHYTIGGITETYAALIIFEQSVSTFTA